MLFKMKKHIPNTITCLNLFSGILAVISAYNADYKMTLIFVIISAIFDFFDGLFARWLKAYSPMGKELDSLADVISFGLVPGMVVYSLLEPLSDICLVLPYFAFLITVFSALRLAKFNIDERQSSSFIGLATPANALFWVALAFEYASKSNNSMFLWIVFVSCFVSAFLLVCELPMFSFKMKSLKWKDAYQQITFLVGVLLLLLCFQIAGVYYSIIWYVFLSLIFYRKNIKKTS